MSPWCGTAVYMSAANLVCAGSGIFASHSAPSADVPSISKGTTASPLSVFPSAAEFLSLTLSAPASSGTQELGSDLELPRLDIPQHPQKCTQRIQHPAWTPVFWEKLLITNIITATTDQQHDPITLWCTFNQDYLMLSLCVSLPVLSRTMLFHTYFCAALQHRSGMFYLHFIMCHLYRRCSCKVITAAHH